jgi:hypothetical protein
MKKNWYVIGVGMLTSLLMFSSKVSAVEQVAFINHIENPQNHIEENISDFFKESIESDASSQLDVIVKEIAHQAALAEMSTPSIVSTEQQEKEIEVQLRQNIDSISMSRTPQYDKYKYDASTVKYATVKGYAGGQPTIGFKRNTGDQLIWNQNGGPSASVSISFGWKAVSVSADLGLGSTGGVGSGFRVPSAGNWKVYAEKVYKVTQPNMWGHPYGSPTGTWVRVDAAPTKTFYDDKTRLIKQ